MKSVRCIASATAKSGEAGLLAFAEKYSLPVEFHDSDQLNTVEAPTPPSQHAMDAIGAAGVAEPAAILSSRGGKILAKKVKRGNVTLAVAETGHDK
jgi:cobalt-precorrin 5A hydrolase